MTGRRLLRALAVVVLPLWVGLFTAATTFPGGTMIPWRPQMVDLVVYRRAGQWLLAGLDPYSLPGALPFVYPPFAVLLAAPMTLVPPSAVEIGWTVANVLVLLAVLYRLELRGWVLSLVTAAAIWFAQPISQTFAFGQVGLLLMGLVYLDLVPGPCWFGRRRLPPGSLTGLAAAVKLTPLLFVVYLLGARRRSAALATAATFAALTATAAALLPAESASFWGRLLHGDTGLGHSIVYYTNQSLVADALRTFGLGRGVTLVALFGAGLLALGGAGAAVLWHRRDPAWAVTLCAVAGLLASPVSWTHHFVWVVPLAVLLVTTRGLPSWFRAVGWLFAGWVAGGPFLRLPGGGDVELRWHLRQNLLASVSLLLGVALLGSAAALGLANHRARMAAQPEHAPRVAQSLPEPVDAP